MDIADPGRGQGLTEALLVELGKASRPGEAPHVREDLDTVLEEEVQECAGPRVEWPTVHIVVAGMAMSG